MQKPAQRRPHRPVMKRKQAQVFTAAQIGRMTPKEYHEQRDEILQALREGRVLS